MFAKRNFVFVLKRVKLTKDWMTLLDEINKSEGKLKFNSRYVLIQSFDKFGPRNRKDQLFQLSVAVGYVLICNICNLGVEVHFCH